MLTAACTFSERADNAFHLMLSVPIANTGWSEHVATYLNAGSLIIISEYVVRFLAKSVFSFSF